MFIERTNSKWNDAFSSFFFLQFPAKSSLYFGTFSLLFNHDFVKSKWKQMRQYSVDAVNVVYFMNSSASDSFSFTYTQSYCIYSQFAFSLSPAFHFAAKIGVLFVQRCMCTAHLIHLIFGSVIAKFRSSQNIQIVSRCKRTQSKTIITSNNNNNIMTARLTMGEKKIRLRT